MRALSIRAKKFRGLLSLAFAGIIVLASKPSSAQTTPTTTVDAKAGAETCTQNASMTLCVKNTVFGHDVYSLHDGPATVLQGIDDETTEGVHSITGLTLKCDPQNKPSSIPGILMEVGRLCTVSRDNTVIETVQVNSP